MPDEIISEKLVEKFLGKLEKKPLLIFLFLSLAFNIWNILDKRKQEDHQREDMARMFTIVAQKDAKIEVVVKEREMALQQVINAQERCINLLPSLQRGPMPGTHR